MINLVKGVTKMNVNFEDHRDKAKDFFVDMMVLILARLRLLRTY